MYEDRGEETALLLGIDTSSEGDLALAALHPGSDIILIARQSLDPRRQSAELLTKLTLLLADAHASLADIHAIVVVNGPGSFTGLRIGISAAKGLAEAGKIPVIALSSLATLAAQEKDTVAVLPAGRAEYYVRLPDGTESLESDDTLPAILRSRKTVVADAALAEKLRATFGEDFAVNTATSGAPAAIRAAVPRFLAGTFDDIAALDANYVRRPYTDLKPLP